MDSVLVLLGLTVRSAERRGRFVEILASHLGFNPAAVPCPDFGGIEVMRRLFAFGLAFCVAFFQVPLCQHSQTLQSQYDDQCLRRDSDDTGRYVVIDGYVCLVR